MKKLLVTGGAGFIGANFVRYWLDSYPEDLVVVLDSLTYAGNLSSLDAIKDNKNFRFVHGDILDSNLVEELLRKESICTIVHFAAESHVDRSIQGPDAFIETNVTGTHSLLKAAKKVWLDEGKEPLFENHRFHHVSTDEVYGSLEADDPPFSEVTPYAPNSPYSASKAASDHLVRAYHHTYGLKVTTSNCSNNYGPFQFPEKLIPLIVINILEGKSLPIYGDGLNIRDWLYVEDHCRGIDLVLRKGNVGEVYNIGGNNEWTNIDIVNLLCRLVDRKVKNNDEIAKRFPNTPAANGENSTSLISFVKDRLGHDKRYAIDATKSQSHLNYIPRESFETGMERTLDWMLSNEAWWRGVMDGSYRAWIDKQYK